MTKLYAAYGKQVQRDGEQFADACDETAAQIIADALNGERSLCDPLRDMIPNPSIVIEPKVSRQFPSGGLLIPPKEPIAIFGETGPEAIMPLHNITQYNDGTRCKCSCGRSWDRDEGDECPGAV